MLKEFKEFALKGNVIDMAIGVIVGGAFGKIVTSLVNDIIMPVFAFLTSGMSVKELAYTFPDSEATIAYGVFLQNVIDFLLISISIFAFAENMTPPRSRKSLPVRPRKSCSPKSATCSSIRKKSLPALNYFRSAGKAFI